MGLKGLTLYHLKSHLQKYRLGQHARKHNSVEAQSRENNGDSYVRFSNLHSASSTIKSSGVGNTEQGLFVYSSTIHKRCLCLDQNLNFGLGGSWPKEQPKRKKPSQGQSKPSRSPEDRRSPFLTRCRPCRLLAHLSNGQVV